MPLTGELSQRCYRLLIRFDDFESHQSLKSIFVKAADLKEYEHDLPEAATRRDRVNRVIAFLLDKYTAKGSVFVIFLNELFSQVPQQDERYAELQELVPLVNAALSARDHADEEYRRVKDEFDFRSSSATAASEESEEGDAEEWFEQARESGTDELAFRIALSVLSGAEYKAFDRAYKNLASTLSQAFAESEGDGATPARRVMPVPDSKRLRAARAQRLERRIAVNSGSSKETISIEVIEICDSQFQLKLLNHLWRDYSFCRNELAEWLTDIAAAKSADIRVRVAVGVGAIAINNFASVRDQILGRWAQCQEHAPEYRAAVGRALGVAIHDPERAEEVAALLRLWSASDKYLLRWAAARAYLYVGMSIPAGEALRQWRTIVSSEEPHVYSPINNRLYINPLILSLLDALRGFFLTALEVPERADEIFRSAVVGLKDWAAEDQQREAAARYGMLVFTMLMQMNQPSSARKAGPVLLSLIDPADSASTYLASLVELFYLALRDDASHKEVSEKLREWVEQLDHGDGHEPQLVALLRGIVEREHPRTRLHQLLVFYLGKWRQQSSAANPAAQRLLSSLG